MLHSSILVFANKQDMKGCLTPTEVCEALGLPRLKNRKWQVSALLQKLRCSRESDWRDLRSRIYGIQ